MRSTSKLLALVLAALVLLLLAWLGTRRSDGSDPALAAVPAPPSPDGAPAARTRAAHSGSSPEALGEAQASGAGRVASEAPGLVLSGHIVGLESPHTYDEVRVALWPERTLPICAQFAVAGPHTRVLRVVRAASDGTFAFEGLEADVRFHLRAGGAGRASLALAEPVSPADGPVRLELARVKALRVELVGLDGKPPRTPPDLLEDGFYLGDSGPKGEASLEPWEQELTGLPGVGCNPDVSPYGRLVVFSGPPEQLAIGPIGCIAELPGYEGERATYWAELVTDRIPLRKLVLRPSTRGWGSVEFEFAGLSDAIRKRIAPEEPIGALIVECGGSPGYLVRLYGPPELKRLDGLPIGSARWSFDSYDGYCQRPTGGISATFQVREQVTRVTIDLSQTGGVRVELDPASRSEAAYLHHATITNDLGREVVQIPAEQLPRLFLLVEAGEWRQTGVAARDPKTGAFRLLELDDGPSARIQPGEIATLRVTARGLAPGPGAR